LNQNQLAGMSTQQVSQALDRIEELERRLGETAAGPATDAADEEADGDD
jgi:hypothetical protein